MQNKLKLQTILKKASLLVKNEIETHGDTLSYEDQQLLEIVRDDIKHGLKVLGQVNRSGNAQVCGCGKPATFYCENCGKPRCGSKSCLFTCQEEGADDGE